MIRNSEKCMVFVADDFGRSLSVNTAIAHAHDHGMLTSASLMAGGEAFDDAVKIARARSGLSTGIHITLCDGKSVLSRAEIPDLVDREGNFEPSPSRAWIRYWKPGLVPQLEAEIGAQFNRLEESGVPATHLDSHHHLHMHPAVFAIVCRYAAKKNVRWIRIPREPFGTVFRFRRSSRGSLSFIEWTVFRLLTVLHDRQAAHYGLQTMDAVYGLSRTGRIDEPYLIDCISRSGEFTEIFTHPDLATRNGRREFDALQSFTVRKTLSIYGIILTGFREISRPGIRASAPPERL